MMRVLQSLTTAASVDRTEQLQYHGNTFSVFAESTAASDSSMTSDTVDLQYRIESSNKSLGTVLVNASSELQLI